FAPNVRTRKFQWLTVGSTIALLGAVVAWGLVRVYLTVVGCAQRVRRAGDGHHRAVCVVDHEHAVYPRREDRRGDYAGDGARARARVGARYSGAAARDGLGGGAVRHCERTGGVRQGDPT